MDVISIGESMVLFSTEQQIKYSSTFNCRVAGAESNTMIGLSKLGHESGWISRIGDDAIGEKVLASIRSEGVDTSYVHVDESAATGIFLREQTTADTSSISYYRSHSAASRLVPEDINSTYINKAKYVYITGITVALSKKCEETIFHLIKVAKELGKTIVFDPNIRKQLHGESERETLKTIIGLSDIILPGLAEGHYLFGTNDCEEIADHCLELGATLCVVKLGERGAYFKQDSHQGSVNPFSVSRVIDPIGAGDGFAAGLLSGLLDSLSIEDAVSRACAVGSYVTQIHGDIEGLPTKTKLHQYMTTSIEDVVR